MANQIEKLRSDSANSLTHRSRSASPLSRASNMEAVPNEARRSVGSAAAGVASKRSSREVPTAKVIGEVRRPPGALVALGVLGDSLAYVSLAHGNVQDLFLRALSYLMRSSGLTRPGERFIRAFILWHTRYLTSGKKHHPPRPGGGGHV
jgi:hypothetical protein